MVVVRIVLVLALLAACARGDAETGRAREASLNAKLKPLAVRLELTDSVILEGTKDAFLIDPVQMLVSDTALIILDQRLPGLLIYKPTGALGSALSATGAGPGAMKVPSGFAIAADGRIAILDAGNGRISVFTSADRTLDRTIGVPWMLFGRFVSFAEHGMLIGVTVRAGGGGAERLVLLPDEPGHAVASTDVTITEGFGNGRYQVPAEPVGYRSPDGLIFLTDNVGAVAVRVRVPLESDRPAQVVRDTVVRFREDPPPAAIEPITGPRELARTHRLLRERGLVVSLTPWGRNGVIVGMMQWPPGGRTPEGVVVVSCQRPGGTLASAPLTVDGRPLASRLDTIYTVAATDEVGGLLRKYLVVSDGPEPCR